jgi:hypothetical protein
MLTVLRYLLLASPPLLLGLGAGWGFAWVQESCGRLVGILLAAKCRGVQLEYQLAFQTWGTALGCVVTAALSAYLELRRRRKVVRAQPLPGGVS